MDAVLKGDSAGATPAHPRRRSDPSCQYLVFDLETTGLGNSCRIVEFAGLVLDPSLRSLGLYETVIDPGVAPGPTWLHGLSRQTLDGAPCFSGVAADIERLFRDRIIVAHNLRFDWSTLRRAFRVLDVEAPTTPGGVCKAEVARHAIGGSRDLVSLCRRLGVEHATPHRAACDVAATAEVLRILRQLAPSATRGHPCHLFAGAWRLQRSVPPRRRHAPGDAAHIALERNDL
jgi:DNA polymerase-3 subunit epsilon